MGFIGVIFKLIGYCIIIAIIVGTVFGIIATRKWLMSKPEIEATEKQYAKDITNHSKNISRKKKPTGKKHKTSESSGYDYYEQP